MGKKVRLSTLLGDAPCHDCGTDQNIVWSTDSAFWNSVCVDDSPILCITCFIKRVEAVGYRPVGWQLLPVWPRRGELTPEHKQKILANYERWEFGEPQEGAE